MDINIYFSKPKYQLEFNILNGYNLVDGQSLSDRTSEDILFIKAAARAFNLNPNCEDSNAVRVV